MVAIDTSSPVMITGATGYVAGQIVKLLLDAGATVHAAVRDPSNEEKLKYLNGLAAESPGEIKYFQADLLEDGSYGAAIEGCSVVFHTASPFAVGVNDPQAQLVDPALKGTRNVLSEVSRHESVRRVVLTSSCVAMYGDNADLEQMPGGIVTEACWNTTSSLTHQPYPYSKTLAEKEAWEIAKQQDRWDMVAINPSLVIGPGINPHATSESFAIIKQLGDGSLSTGAPRFCFGCVDVRDVAYAHVSAAFTPEANGRNILSGHDTDLYEISETLVEKYGKDYPIPRRVAPKWLTWLFGPIINKGMTRKMVTLNVNVPWKADNSKSIKELGVSYRPLEESTTEMFQQLVDCGAFKKK